MRLALVLSLLLVCFGVCYGGESIDSMDEASLAMSGAWQMVDESGAVIVESYKYKIISSTMGQMYLEGEKEQYSGDPKPFGLMFDGEAFYMRISDETEFRMRASDGSMTLYSSKYEQTAIMERVDIH
jgi:hypothetical protein